MPRSAMGLTLADLEILSTLVDQQPRSHSAAAELVGLNRPRLARLIQRVNDHIGEDLDWRANGRFRPPPEVRRLVHRYSEFGKELAELNHAPRVSAGTSAMLLLIEVQSALGRQLPRISIVRSRDVWHALESDEIDIAITHGRSVGMASGADVQELKPRVWGRALVDWKAVVVTRNDSRLPTAADRFRLRWESGSLGDQLSRLADRPRDVQERAEAEVPCQSFLQAIELVRRGLVANAVVPDIYVSHLAKDLAREPTPLPITDQLVAVFRAEEQSRWAWLLETPAWRRSESSR